MIPSNSKPEKVIGRGYWYITSLGELRKVLITSVTVIKDSEGNIKITHLSTAGMPMIYCNELYRTKKEAFIAKAKGYEQQIKDELIIADNILFEALYDYATRKRLSLDHITLADGYIKKAAHIYTKYYMIDDINRVHQLRQIARYKRKVFGSE